MQAGHSTLNDAPGPVWLTSATPSGVEVRYSPVPKRMYQVRQGFRSEGGDGGGYTEWREVPSVTTVLGCLEKKGLPYWGNKVGVDGVLELVRRGKLHLVGNDICHWNTWAWDVSTQDDVMSLLVEEKLTVNHQRDKAGARGQAVHDAFETWAKTGAVPDPTIFPEEEWGYVLGLNQFLEDVDPEPIEAEVMVGSVEHGFAGRYDIRLRVTKECNVVFHRTPVKGPQYARLYPGVYLGDLKTSKGTYQESHGRQLEAYELASVECGYEPTSARGILNVTADGTYKFVRSTCTADDFLAVLRVWESNQRIKGAK